MWTNFNICIAGETFEGPFTAIVAAVNKLWKISFFCSLLLNQSTISLQCTRNEVLMKFSIKDFFSKCDQICRKLRVWSHLLKKPLMENFFFFLQCYHHDFYPTFSEHAEKCNTWSGCQIFFVICLHMAKVIASLSKQKKKQKKKKIQLRGLDLNPSSQKANRKVFVHKNTASK